MFTNCIRYSSLFSGYKEYGSMGEYDFSYEIPANFDNRVNQYLVQFGLGQLAEAFKQCKYGYTVVDYAYYAGLKGDNWNKKGWL